METTNDRIRRIRKSKGLKQTDVCSFIGLTQPSYASIEAGRTKSISIELGKSLAKVLEVGFYELFEIEIETQPINQDKKEIEQLKKRIEELEEQLSDKRQINLVYANSLTHFKGFMEFFIKMIYEHMKNGTGITTKKSFEMIYKRFLEETGNPTQVFKDNDFIFKIFTDDELAQFDILKKK